MEAAEDEVTAGAAGASTASASVGSDVESRGGAANASAGVDTVGTAESDTLPNEEMLYDLADLFKVFADTTRIKILYCLMGKQLCVADIAEAINATQSAASHQLRILKQAHLVKFRRDGKNVIYELSDDHVYTMLSQGMTHLCE